LKHFFFTFLLSIFYFFYFDNDIPSTANTNIYLPITGLE